MTIQLKDFIEIDYTGSIKEDGIIFDTTMEAVAKEQQIHNPEMTYGPIIICVGEGQVIKGLDNQFIGKEAGEFTIEVPTEQAFGKKNSKLLKLIPLQVFTKQNIRPIPGLQLNMDGVIGTVRSVSGGRIFVDFNHPLSGKDLIYKVKIHRKIADPKEKLDAFLKMQFGKQAIENSILDSKATISVPLHLPKDIQETFSSKIKEIIPEIKEIDFKEPPKEKKATKDSDEKDTSEKLSPQT